MIFFIILIVCMIIGLITNIVIRNVTINDCELGIITFSVLLMILLIVFPLLILNRKQRIFTYYECKTYPEYFSNEERKKNNKIIADIKTFQGTIFSFYNGIDFEYFEIEDGQKVIINEGKEK